MSYYTCILVLSLAALAALGLLVQTLEDDQGLTKH